MSSKIIGLTGGIGSGKTTVANLFKELNIPIYIADVEAKKLMNSSKVIKKKLILLFGANAYVNNELNKGFISKQIFENKELLQKMNAIVHPKVKQHFHKWVEKQSSPYVIYESALIFESQTKHQFHFIITVVSPKNLRQKRVVKRDNSSLDKVNAIISNQLGDDIRMKHSNLIIENIKLEDLDAQVQNAHTIIMDSIEKSEI